MRRTLALLLAMIMALSCCAVAFAEDDIQADLFEAAVGVEADSDLPGEDEDEDEPEAAAEGLDVEEAPLFAGEDGHQHVPLTGDDLAKKLPEGVTAVDLATGIVRIENKLKDDGTATVCGRKEKDWCICAKCGADFYKEVEPTNMVHEGTEGTVKIAPTCTKPGVKTLVKCDVCGAKNVEAPIPALEHSYKSQYVEATCTEGAHTLYTCTRNCGEEGASYKVYDPAYPKLDHKNADGSSAWVKVTIEAKDPTCLTDGAVAGEVDYCPLCKTYKNGTNMPIIPALKPEHVGLLDSLFDGYDDENGNPIAYGVLDSYATLIKDRALGDHYNYNDDALQTIWDAREGDDKGVAVTDGTPVTVTLKEPVVNSIGGVQYEFCATTCEYKKPTCVEAGYLKIKTECGYERNEVLKAIGHQWMVNEDHKHVIESYDCTIGGMALYTCTICGEEYQAEVAPMPSHDFDDEDYWYYYQVLADGTEVYDYNYDPDGPQPGDKNYTGVIAPCHDYVLMARCCHDIGWNCTITKTLKTFEGDPSLHEYIDGENDPNWVNQLPTCEDDGFVYFYCIKCKDATRQDVPALGHKYDWDTTLTWTYKDGTTKPHAAVTKAATCTTDGVITAYCGNNASHTITKVIPAYGHKYEWTIVNRGDCKTGKKGEKALICERCGDKKETQVIDPVHTCRFEDFWTDGSAYDKKQEKRVTKEEIMKATEMINGKEVKVVETYKPTSCETAGSISYYCDVCCTLVTNAPIAALGHVRDRKDFVPTATMVEYNGTYWDKVKAEANCLHGKQYSYTCPDCKKTLTADDGNKTPHSLYFNSENPTQPLQGVVITKLPTDLEEGSMAIKCAVCQKPIENIKLNKLPHNYKTVFVTAAGDPNYGKYVSQCIRITKTDATSKRIYKNKANAYVSYKAYALEQVLDDIELVYLGTDEQKAAARAALEDQIWNRIVSSNAYADDKAFVKGVGEHTDVKVLEIKAPHYTVAVEGGKAKVTLDKGCEPLKDAFLWVSYMYRWENGKVFDNTTCVAPYNRTYYMPQNTVPNGATLVKTMVAVVNDMELWDDDAGVVGASNFGWVEY